MFALNFAIHSACSPIKARSRSAALAHSSDRFRKLSDIPEVSEKTGCGLDDRVVADCFSLPKMRSSGSSVRVVTLGGGAIWYADVVVSNAAPGLSEALDEALGEPPGDPCGDPPRRSDIDASLDIEVSSAARVPLAARDAPAPGAGSSRPNTSFGSNSFGSHRFAMIVDENTAGQDAPVYAADRTATFSARITRISAVNADIDTSNAARIALIMERRFSRRSSSMPGSINAIFAARHSELARCVAVRLSSECRR